ncbi:MAG: monofunctional biosynthetic peptidoglycan transglycosylase [Phycisphaerae bacterium]|nr:monofunctional biosynthetic peptidoglycan transglycosylase [Saprospiraceae bacterium]
MSNVQNPKSNIQCPPYICPPNLHPVNIFARILRRWYRSIPQDEFGRLLWGKYFRRLFFKLTLWFFGITIGFTLLYAVLPIPVTPLMIERCWQQAWDDERNVRLKHDWVSFGEISPHLQLAVVCAEDQDFLEHEGFDFEAIEKAYKYNKNHKRKKGASTISQQTAKNVFLWPSRSWIRKGFEVYFTFLIETVWSKERIMTAYLNSIEFGDGIYGAEAAARHFYGKNAKTLNRQEAAMLASVLPNPLIFKVESPSSKVLQRKQWVLSQMRMWGGKIDYDEPNTPKKSDK